MAELEVQADNLLIKISHSPTTETEIIWLWNKIEATFINDDEIHLKYKENYRARLQIKAKENFYLILKNIPAKNTHYFWTDHPFFKLAGKTVEFLSKIATLAIIAYFGFYILVKIGPELCQDLDKTKITSLKPYCTKYFLQP